MSDPATLQEAMNFVAVQRGPFRPYAETFLYWMREACERSLTAGQALTTPIASVDRLSALYAKFTALQAT